MHHQRRFAGCRRAFERRPADGDENAALGERRKDFTQTRRAGKGIELGGVCHSRRCGKIVVGSERDDQEIRFMGSAIGRDALRNGIDQRDRFLEKTHAGFHEFLIRQSHRVGPRMPEHHVELREAEIEGVALVNQRHFDVVAKRLQSMVLSSSPPKPAPRMRMRFFIELRNGLSFALTLCG